MAALAGKPNGKSVSCVSCQAPFFKGRGRHNLVANAQRARRVSTPPQLTFATIACVPLPPPGIGCCLLSSLQPLQLLLLVSPALPRPPCRKWLGAHVPAAASAEEASNATNAASRAGPSSRSSHPFPLPPVHPHHIGLVTSLRLVLSRLWLPICVQLLLCRWLSGHGRRRHLGCHCRTLPSPSPSPSPSGRVSSATALPC